ncbi:MAG: divergent polysaccharide deacetylase family protein [Candidatus Aminicenantes bacterium]|nr:divergent polysaccharide deacetylase family protein [Candidatus Aminicenantes bacterium]
MANRKKSKRKKQQKKNVSVVFFAMFIAIAIFTVALLEYIDFKKGKESFIFSKLIPLKTRPQKITAFNKRFIQILEKERILFEHFKDAKGKYHFKFKVGREDFAGLIARVKTLSGKLDGGLDLSEIRRIDDKSLMLYSLRIEKQVSHIVLVTRLEKAAAKKKPAGKKEKKKQPKEIVKAALTPTPTPKKTPAPVREAGKAPRIAFIIDDIGEYDIGALELKRLDVPITASILPDSPRAFDQARWVQEYRLQALIHIPMQPKNSNGRKYSPQKTITLRSTDAEIRALVRRAKEVVPQARGVNNHMGSLVTANKEMMRRFLKIIKEEGLFFVDSRTTGDTVGYDLAGRMGIKTAMRDVFLDDGEKTYENSVSEIKRLVDKAFQEGSAIAIGHPHRTTIRAIQDSIKFIKEKGVKIVFVSELLE